LKTLFIAQRVPFPPNKGEKIRTYHQIKYLYEQGHEISICCPIDSNEDLTSIEAFKSLYDIAFVTHSLFYKPFRLLSGLFNRKALSVANFYNARLQALLEESLASNHYDAIVCTSSSMAEYVFRSPQLKKLNAQDSAKPLLVMDFMDLDSDKWAQYATGARWPMRGLYQRESRLLANYEQRIQQAFDACFFISQAEVDLFDTQFGTRDKVHVLGNGIDGNYFRPSATAIDNKAPVFLFTGVMDYKPNVDAIEWFVGQVWQRIIDLYPGARFIVAGMNPGPNIVTLGQISGIEITGFVDDILPYYHESDYFIAPLRIARGVQNKILQAFACGLPVIATDMGAEGIKYSDGQDILLANSPGEFVTQIQLLESDTELKHQLIDNAIELVRKEYSWEGNLKVLDEILSDLTQQPADTASDNES
jgi:sugar transferase (PEP-CTERM/EpsH1 system associated)